MSQWTEHQTKESALVVEDLRALVKEYGGDLTVRRLKDGTRDVAMYFPGGLGAALFLRAPSASNQSDVHVVSWFLQDVEPGCILSSAVFAENRNPVHFQKATSIVRSTEGLMKEMKRVLTAEKNGQAYAGQEDAHDLADDRIPEKGSLNLAQAGICALKAPL